MCHFTCPLLFRKSNSAMATAGWLLLVLVLNVCDSRLSPGPGPRVAVIGGGIGGSATAYFLSQRMPGADITVIEMGEVGGRLATREVAGRRWSLLFLLLFYLVGTFTFHENISF